MDSARMVARDGFDAPKLLGEWAIRFAPDGAKTNESEYVEIVARTYLPGSPQL